MNDVLDGWSSPWRALHKSLAAGAPDAQGQQPPVPGGNSWLRQARAAADATRARREHTTEN